MEQKYDKFKVDRLKLYLENQASKGQARYFEIYVDGLKAVPRTNDPAEFDTYEDYLDEDTEKMRILIYSSSATSARHDKHCFILKKAESKPEPQQQSQSLSGIEIKEQINEQLAIAKERWDTDLIKKELEQTKQQLNDAETYIDTLENMLTEARAKRSGLGGVNWERAIEGFLSHPKVASKLGDAAEGLSGFFSSDTKEKQSLPPELPQPETSFEKVTDSDPELSEQQKQYVTFLQQLEERFDQQEMQKVMYILNMLAGDPAQIDPIIQLFQKEGTSQNQHEQ